jgi:hypothetical protein
MRMPRYLEKTLFGRTNFHENTQQADGHDPRLDELGYQSMYTRVLHLPSVWQAHV